jgi:hypothetical protein
VIFLRFKLKWGLNALLPEHVGLIHLAFEYSMRDFFEAQFVEQWTLSALVKAWTLDPISLILLSAGVFANKKIRVCKSK